MRVVAGNAKGRPLIAPDGVETRPTGDRVRESLFNALYSLGDPVDGARVLDLYAGSGALGIEALSRGATSATFVDRSQRAISVIERNLQATRTAGDDTRTVRAEVLDWLARAPGEYDLVLCDPPYEFTDWPQLLTSLEKVVPTGLLVIESDRPIETGPGWDAIRSRRYGGTVVSIVRRRISA